ncbi:Nuclear transport factor 2-like protein [Drosera capensis]
MLVLQIHLITDKGYLEQSIKYALSCGLTSQWLLGRKQGFPPKEGLEEERWKHKRTDLPAELVANAFVEQFYKMLHEHTDVTFRFYHESSTMSCRGVDGTLTTVTGLELMLGKSYAIETDMTGCFTAIKDVIQSSNLKTEILTADSQPSYMKGVIIIITGYLTDDDNGKRKFTESFSLAQIDKSYFVLNDIFRFIDEEKQQAGPCIVKEIHEEVVAPTATMELWTREVPSDSSPVQKVMDPVTHNVEAWDPSRKYTPGTSYASVLSTGKPDVAKATRSTLPSASANIGAKSGKVAPAVIRCTLGICLMMPPLSKQVEREFKRFRTIKKGRVQVRCNKEFFFGFVKFESSKSMEKAIEGSTIRMGGKEAFIQEKRSATRVVNGGNSFRSRPDDYHNDNFNGRSNFNSGRVGGGGGYERNGFRSNNYGRRDDSERDNYGRNNYVSRRDFPKAVPNGNGYGRTYQNGDGRGGRRGPTRQEY